MFCFIYNSNYTHFVLIVDNKEDAVQALSLSSFRYLFFHLKLLLFLHIQNVCIHLNKMLNFPKNTAGL